MGHGSPRPLPAHTPEGDWQNNTSGLTEIKTIFRTNLICMTFLLTTSQVAYLTSFGILHNIPIDLSFPHVFYHLFQLWFLSSPGTPQFTFPPFCPFALSCIPSTKRRGMPWPQCREPAPCRGPAPEGTGVAVGPPQGVAALCRDPAAPAETQQP